MQRRVIAHLGFNSKGLRDTLKASLDTRLAGMVPDVYMVSDNGEIKPFELVLDLSGSLAQQIHDFVHTQLPGFARLSVHDCKHDDPVGNWTDCNISNYQETNVG